MTSGVLNGFNYLYIFPYLTNFCNIICQGWRDSLAIEACTALTEDPSSPYGGLTATSDIHSHAHSDAHIPAQMFMHTYNEKVIKGSKTTKKRMSSIRWLHLTKTGAAAQRPSPVSVEGKL